MKEFIKLKRVQKLRDREKLVGTELAIIFRYRPRAPPVGDYGPGLARPIEKLIDTISKLKSLGETPTEFGLQKYIDAYIISSVEDS